MFVFRKENVVNDDNVDYNDNDFIVIIMVIVVVMLETITMKKVFLQIRV